jgi:hypothetical protein
LRNFGVHEHKLNHVIFQINKINGTQIGQGL